MNCAHKSSISKFKSYLRLFICTTTEAVQLEFVSGVSTAAFLAAMHRFISRKGCPSKIMSDKATNFKNAAKHLSEFIQLCRGERAQDFCTMKVIQWFFNPPYTSYFRGLWESSIKNAK